MPKRPCLADLAVGAKFACLAVLPLSLALGGCHGKAPPSSTGVNTTGMVLRRVEFRELPGWRGDMVSEALPALHASCEVLDSEPTDGAVGPNGLAGRAGEWSTACRALTVAPRADAALRRIIEASFVPFAVGDADGPDGFFTGYYEPELRGSRVRTATYAVPLYRPPQDLVSVGAEGETRTGRMVDGRLQPYYSRQAIDG